eukprot:1713385-Rhodomonas_salina.1
MAQQVQSTIVREDAQPSESLSSRARHCGTSDPETPPHSRRVAARISLANLVDAQPQPSDLWHALPSSNSWSGAASSSALSSEPEGTQSFARLMSDSTPNPEPLSFDPAPADPEPTFERAPKSSLRVCQRLVAHVSKMFRTKLSGNVKGNLLNVAA